MKPSEWLDSLDSHTIYGELVLEDLDEQYRECIPLHSHADTLQAIEARGLGGTLTMEDDGINLFYGYSAAHALARRCVGKTSTKGGRGWAFRENLQTLREAGY